jgi:formate hydrogenlyase subunit 6/NADH:ubiquinone oxidoreductase subunit I
MPGKGRALKKNLKKMLKGKANKKGRKEGAVKPVRKVIDHNRELCNDCGACVSLCPATVMWLDKRSNLVVEKQKCIGCGNCVDACPRRALSLD